MIGDSMSDKSDLPGGISRELQRLGSQYKEEVKEKVEVHEETLSNLSKKIDWVMHWIEERKHQIDKDRKEQTRFMEDIKTEFKYRRSAKALILNVIFVLVISLMIVVNFNSILGILGNSTSLNLSETCEHNKKDTG